MENRRKTLKQSYFDWLYKQVDGHKRSYRQLCAELNKKKFRWSVHNDDNRCEDGLNLRRQFVEDLDEGHLEVQYFLKGDCTIFEMLIALAQRMNFLTDDLKSQEDTTPRWFHELIQNLCLSQFTDSVELSAMDSVKIDGILENFMDRTYGYDGSGGLFPLKRRPRKDQAQIEIWEQLMLYLNENYG